MIFTVVPNFPHLLTETAVRHDKRAADTQLREDQGQLGFGGARSGRHRNGEPPR